MPADSISPTSFRRLLRLGRVCARAAGLRGEDVEDSAALFLEWAALRPVRFQMPEPLLRLAALHRARDYAKHLRRTRGREALWVGSSLPDDRPSAAAEDPERVLLDACIAPVLARALASLPPGHRDLFLRHCLRGESPADLAARTGRSQAAIRQCLFQIRRRLRSVLAGADGSLSELPSSARPRPRDP